MLIMIKSHELSKKMLLSIVANIDEAKKPSSWEQDGIYD
jgi:hypothetical protein